MGPVSLSAQEKISEPEPPRRFFPRGTAGTSKTHGDARAIDREEVHFQQGGGKPEEKEREKRESRA